MRKRVILGSVWMMKMRMVLTTRTGARRWRRKRERIRSASGADGGRCNRRSDGTSVRNQRRGSAHMHAITTTALALLKVITILLRSDGQSAVDGGAVEP